MIESITIKNVAVFDDNGIQINDLNKVNFIYGANASGKTTISNYLHIPDNGKYKNCSIKWKNDTKLQTLVYNKDFRERNFGNGKIAGVFTLGEASKEQRKKIEDNLQQLKDTKEKLVQKDTTIKEQEENLKKLEQDFTEDCWNDIYKKYENIFKEAFAGSIGSGEKFKIKLLQEFANNVEPLVSYDELEKKAKTIFGEQPIAITKISQIVFDRVIEIENNHIWEKTIVGTADVDIAKLINNLKMNDWVNQGRNYLQEDSICPFCQQPTINDDLKKQLESFFDETYLDNIKLLKKLRIEYNSLLEKIIEELNTIEKNQKNIKDTKLDLDKFSVYLKTLISQYTANKECLNNKENEPSRICELISLKEQFELIRELIVNANNEIDKHNNIVGNFKTEKSNLIKFIWKFVIEEFKPNIINFNKKKTGLETGITNLRKQREELSKKCQTLDFEIKNLNKNITSIQPTIDKINKLLESFGFFNFKIESSKENGFYQIEREDKSIAEKTLSEGEITFITFLYFLQLTKGSISEETINEERILVIDDPISSLDSNVLFIISSIIKGIISDIKKDTGNIKQLILLTHNIYFHKEVSYEGLNRKGEKPYFWILRKNIKHSTIQFYGCENPIQSSYELLWRELKEWDKNSGITIQNTMRRILENFFSILGNKKDDFLISKFDNHEEKEICRSLLCWMNEGSHTINDDLYIQEPTETVKNYLNVFKKIFALTGNEGHYDMMMQKNEENKIM